MNASTQDAMDSEILIAAVVFIEGVVRSLIDKPDLAEIHADTHSQRIYVSVTVNQDDLRYVIGEGGRTARSLRTILSALGTKAGRYISLDIRQRPE